MTFSKKPENTSERIIVALDVPDKESALKLVQQLSPLGVRFKIGMQLYYSTGAGIIKEIKAIGGSVFTDLKLHDIPTTVGKASQSLVETGSDFFNVHCSGGSMMMKTARTMADEKANALGLDSPIIIGVTVLTSMDDNTLLSELGVGHSTEIQALHLAKLAQDSGLDGVVCSAQEAPKIRDLCGDDFILVTPGIRPAEGDTQDQHRVVTPDEAVANGSDYLVIGRPITQADNPVSATQAIIESLQGITPKRATESASRTAERLKRLKSNH